MSGWPVIFFRHQAPVCRVLLQALGILGILAIILEIMEVEEMNSLLLDVIVFSDFSDDFGHLFEECLELSPPLVQDSLPLGNLLRLGGIPVDGDFIGEVELLKSSVECFLRLPAAVGAVLEKSGHIIVNT